MKPLRIYPVSLGCPKNEADLEVALDRLTAAGHTLAASTRYADAIIVNTCAFTDDARAESGAALADCAAAAKRGVLVVALGCLAQREREQLYERYPFLAAVAGPGEAAHLPAIIARARGGARPVRCGGMTTAPLAAARVKLTPSHYAWLRIAEGCDNCCHYCIIPSLRGPFRSRPVAAIVREAKQRRRAGAKELMLVAQDTTRYGSDLRPRTSLAALLRALAEGDGTFWLRVLYAHPAQVTDEFLRALADLAPVVRYLDLPLQHAHPAVLKAMGRPVLDHRALVARLRDAVPGLALRTTLMTGYPGEGEEEFAALQEFVRAMRFDRLGLFCFQPQPGTPAFNLRGHLDPEVKEQRRQTLGQLQEEISAARNAALVGSEVIVLIDRVQGHGGTGRTAADAPGIDQTVRVRGKVRRGTFARVRITGSDAFSLTGKCAPERTR